MPSNLCPEQAERVSVAAEILLWGYPGKSFRPSLPFNQFPLDSHETVPIFLDNFLGLRHKVPLVIHNLIQKGCD
jgi:hypothetical protein